MELDEGVVMDKKTKRKNLDIPQVRGAIVKIEAHRGCDPSSTGNRPVGAYHSPGPELQAV